MQKPSPSQFIIVGNRNHPFGMFTRDRQPCEPLIFEDQKCAKKSPSFLKPPIFSAEKEKSWSHKNVDVWANMNAYMTKSNTLTIVLIG